MALGFPQELRSFAQGFAKCLDQGLHARTPKRSSHELHKRTCCCWSGSYKILPPRASHKRAFTQAPVRHGICKIVMQGPLSLREGLTRISTRSSVKDLYRIMQGPLREEFSRISTKGPSMREFTMTMPRTKSLRTPPRKLYASSRSRNAHGHVTRAILSENLQEKCRGPRSGHAAWRACAIKLHMDMSQGPHYARIYRQNAAPQNLRLRFERTCAVEMHMDISQEQLYARICRKMPQGRWSTLMYPRP